MNMQSFPKGSKRMRYSREKGAPNHRREDRENVIVLLGPKGKIQDSQAGKPAGL